MPDGVTDRVLGRRFRIEGKVWTVAAIVAGTRPWCWLVNVERSQEQARMPLSEIERMEPEPKG